ncbi:hypothetical protein DIE15_22305 [Burkholderia sp. Bp9031]|nr:hypothetical protein DIE15_22305 [Burkholderia sp. Bp9031]
MPVSPHPRVPHGNRPTAVLPFIRFVRKDQAVRAGQLDAESSSTVQGRIDCAGRMPALSRLARTLVGRIARQIVGR